MQVLTEPWEPHPQAQPELELPVLRPPLAEPPEDSVSFRSDRSYQIPSYPLAYPDGLANPTAGPFQSRCRLSPSFPLEKTARRRPQVPREQA